tara:strand:+ start:1910 stop:2710 length:801 start_codon:yes stop_codon:yes gene_type:complete
VLFGVYYYLKTPSTRWFLSIKKNTSVFFEFKSRLHINETKILCQHDRFSKVLTKSSCAHKRKINQLWHKTTRARIYLGDTKACALTSSSSMGDRRDGVAPLPAGGGVAEMVDAAVLDDARSNQMSRRETRTKYRLMQTDIETNREEMKQVNSRKLATMIDKVEEVYNTTNVGMKTREQELDLKIVSVLTGIGHDMSKNLNQNGRSRYTTSQVLNGLTSLFMRGRRKDEQTLADEDAEFVSDGAMDWAALGSAASKYCFGVETMEFM